MSRMMRNDVVIGGSSNDSAQITYEPSGRAQTNVSDELDRLNSNLTTDTPDITITTSGRTLAQMMYALDGAVDKSKLTRHSCIEYGGIYAHIEYNANYVGFAWNIINVSAQKGRTIYFKMGTGQNEVVEYEGTTFADLSANVATSDIHFYY